MEHDYFEEPVGAQSKVNVLVEVGTLEIRPHEEPLITIEVEARHMKVTAGRNENTVFVRAERDESWSRKLGRLFRNDNPEAHVVIHAPADCRPEVKVVTGKLSVQGITAPVTARVVTGRLKLANLGGPIYAKNVTGAIHYQGELTADNHRFETTTGHIYLGLSQLPNAQLDARTTTGHIHCDLPLAERRQERHIPGGRLSGVFGSGKGHIAARVVTGKIEFDSVHPFNPSSVISRQSFSQEFP